MGAVRFLATADWQLGMRRYFLNAEAQARFSQDRIDVLRAMAGLAAEEGCAFVVAAGDLFESNQVDRRTLGRALDALASFPMPVCLLPGNHDPLDAASIYASPDFARAFSDRLMLLDDAQPIAVAPGIEVVGAPWPSKRPRRDLANEALAGLAPAPPGTTRVLVAHGIVDTLSPDLTDPSRIALDSLRAALEEGIVHFVALGDRHSATEVAPRVWYAGAPEATAYDETRSGTALLVTIDGERCTVDPRRVGRWRFLEREHELDDDAQVDALLADLDAQPDKERTIVKLRLRGGLSLRARAKLDAGLAERRERFAALEERRAGLDVIPDELDLGELGLQGFARGTVEALEETARTAPDDDARAVAQDALALLYRLAREEAP